MFPLDRIAVIGTDDQLKRFKDYIENPSAAKTAGLEKKEIALKQRQRSLEEQLHDPDSAKLEPRSEMARGAPDRRYAKSSTKGRAKNAFGAYIYGEWECLAAWNGERARVVSFETN